MCINQSTTVLMIAGIVNKQSFLKYYRDDFIVWHARNIENTVNVARCNLFYDSKPKLPGIGLGSEVSKRNYENKQRRSL